MIQILLSFLAGVLTILAPCILLPLPIILGGSVGQRSSTRPLFITFGFVLSFAGVALCINFLVQQLGLNPNVLRDIAVVLLALFAFFMMWPAPFEKLMAHASGLINKAGQTGQKAGSGNLGGFVLGLIIGIIWAPCAGPILGAILTLIALEQNTARASGLLVAYALGAGLPMLAIAYGGQALTTKVRSIAKYSARLQKMFGLILLILAVAIYFQYDTKLLLGLSNKFPGIGAVLENNLFQNQLNSCDSSFFPTGKACEKTDSKEGDTPSQTVNNLPMNTDFKDYGPAPDFTGISRWLNSDPLTVAQLRGKVVLVDFWTYTCINCIRTLPYVTKWYDTYRDNGLVVIGVHTPEFAFEKDTQNVARAISQFKIHYPVAQDNDYGTWRAFNNHYWPAEYLIDKTGKIVHYHFGEGGYDETENAIRQLLGMNTPANAAETGQNLSGVKSPEMYFGLDRLENFSQKASTSPAQYVIPNRLDLNKFALEGTWQFEPDKAVLTKGPGKIKLHFSAAKVHIVAASGKPVSITARVDNYAPAIVQVSDSELYTVFDSTDYGDHVLEINIPDGGFEAFTFTFG